MAMWLTALVFPNFLPWILAAATLILWIRSFIYPSGMNGMLLRITAVGMTALLAGWTAQTAVGTGRLALGLGVTVPAVELLTFLANRFGAGKWPGRSAGYLFYAPAVVAFLVIMPYGSMLTYFFGFDVGILCFGGVSVLAYAGLVDARSDQRKRILHTLIAVSGLMLSVWMAVRISAI